MAFMKALRDLRTHVEVRGKQQGVMVPDLDKLLEDVKQIEGNLGVSIPQEKEEKDFWSYTRYMNALSSSEYAFSSQEPFETDRDVTRERILQHLTWDPPRDKTIPSTSFISAFDSIEKAKDRIKTEYLFPAYFVPAKSNIRIPVWLDRRRVALPQPGMWISIDEVRSFYDFGKGKGKGQDDEWLACGIISKELIEQIIPYDGKALHEERSQIRVVCKRGVFDWEARVWKPIPQLQYVGIVDDESDSISEEAGEMGESRPATIADVAEELGNLHIGKDSSKRDSLEQEDILQMC
ncbi:hypothetical protein CC80DRAFT_552510 [Byssothecium circinans]|uniref:Uncharacterized protein n=1 Tax=Byssothecium circinans TaxID=147558 RepID=A0A6A5TIF3_9PLEO|nr:hypothetical protein CC80DRAFT_552510 [Byssothecium circinans]